MAQGVGVGLAQPKQLIESLTFNPVGKSKDIAHPLFGAGVQVQLQLLCP
jgi:hypothetical protein